MQADLNAGCEQENLRPIGVVIITRLIEDADAIAQQINELAGCSVAIAHHTKNKADATDVYNRDVLVICHQAFLNAAKAWSMQDVDRWDRISLWRGGMRHLVIIDEALANVVDSSKATTANLTTVLSSVTHQVRLKFPQAIGVLEDLKRWLKAKEAGDAENKTSLLWGEGSENHAGEVRLLREALSGMAFDPVVFKEDAPIIVDEILQDVEAMLSALPTTSRAGISIRSTGQLTYCLPDFRVPSSWTQLRAMMSYISCLETGCTSHLPRLAFATTVT